MKICATCGGFIATDPDEIIAGTPCWCREARRDLVGTSVIALDELKSAFEKLGDAKADTVRAILKDLYALQDSI